MADSLNGGSGNAPVHGWRLRAMVLSVAAAAGAYLALALWAGWKESLDAIARIGPVGLAAALALSLVNYGLRFVRWQHYLGRLGHRLARGPSLRIYVGGFALTTTPAKAGEAVRSVLLRHHGVPYSQSLAALFSERLADVLAMVLLAGLGLLTYPPARPLLVAVGGAVVLAVWMLQRERWLQGLQDKMHKRRSRVGRLLAGVLGILVSSSHCFRAPTLALSIVLGLIAWAAEGLALHYMVVLTGTDVALTTSLFIYALAMLVGAVSFIPGGLGSTEAAMIALLVLHGVPEGAAAAVTVLVRLATLWFAVALGLVALALGAAPTERTPD